MNTKLVHNVPIKCRGRFQLIKHTGHKYDEAGNVVQYGEVIEETSPRNNTITLVGFNSMLGAFSGLNGNGTMGILSFVLGSGNTSPSEADSTLVNYAGKSNTHVSTITTRNVTPNLDGDVMWRTTYRVTFAPGSLGDDFVNITEAGVVMGSVTFETINGSTLVGARGLLEDGEGDPTSVSLDASSEYIDLIWEYTEWVPAVITGTVTLSIDGSSVVHNYEVRPCWFENTGGSFNNRGWKNMGALAGPAFAPVFSAVYDASNANTVALTGPLGALYGENPTGTYDTDNRPSAMIVQPYTSNSKYRDIELVWTPLYGNIDIGAIKINTSHFQWQMSLNPVIDKMNTKIFRITIRTLLANRG